MEGEGGPEAGPQSLRAALGDLAVSRGPGDCPLGAWLAHCWCSLWELQWGRGWGTTGREVVAGSTAGPQHRGLASPGSQAALCPRRP